VINSRGERTALQLDLTNVAIQGIVDDLMDTLDVIERMTEPKRAFEEVKKEILSSRAIELTMPIEPIPPMRRGQSNSYSPADIKRWGVQRFLDEVCPKEPFQIPDLGFTEEENRQMDQILKQEREANL
jgi:hypothetical protein